MRTTMTRRRFLQAGALSGAGVTLLHPAAILRTATPEMQAAGTAQGICVTVANHWSYIGIGWQLGIESCVLSATDAMEMADRAPHVKTLLNLDARAYEFMAETFPEVAKKLAGYLAAGKVELIGGTYSQPMGVMYSGESNIRQIAWGREIIRKTFGCELATFLEEEDFSHPQVPQIVAGSGFKYASLAQLDTWGRTGIPVLEYNVIDWQGIDGTAMTSVPKNSLFGYSPNLKELAASPAFAKLREQGKPLIFSWEEFGWESEEEPAYLKAPEKYLALAKESPVEFVTIAEYLDKYGRGPREKIFLPMDAWHKLLPWGLGGDQLRILDRKVEALLLAAERFDALAGALGERTQESRLEKAWKDLMTAQSHDVGLCEHSRWQGDRMAPLDRIEDKRNYTWGAIGYQHLDAAERDGREVLDTALDSLAKRIDSRAGQQGPSAVTVFNPTGWEREEIVTTDRIYPVPAQSKGVVVKDAAGRVVPSQIVKSGKDGQGNLVMVNVAFLAGKVPGVGYDTYYLEFVPGATPSPATDLRIDEDALAMENEFVRLRLSPRHGAIESLVDKKTGREMLDGRKGPFPVFKGRPNPDYALRSVFVKGKYTKEDMVIPALFDSSTSEVWRKDEHGATAPTEAHDWKVVAKSDIQWLEKGPLRATVRTRHNWPLLKFEIRVTLCAHSSRAEVTTRLLPEIPPPPDALDAGRQFPARIKEGYWLTFAPGFDVTTVLRDYPLGIEPAGQDVLQGLTFVDLMGRDCGLLVLHAGTQYFNRDPDGVFSNLLLREWESFWSGEYGWPRYSEYRHALLPHGANMSNAERLRASAEFAQHLLCVVRTPQAGHLPKRKGFIVVAPESVQLSAFRKDARDGYELRVVEVEGRAAAATVHLDVPVASAVETNLVGRKMGEVSRSGGRLAFETEPWKVRTFKLS